MTMSKLALVASIVALATGAAVTSIRSRTVVSAQQASAPAASAPGVVTAPQIPFDTTTDFLKYSPDMNLGEVLGIAVIGVSP